MASALAVEQHQQRADRHLHIGRALFDAGDEWAAVPFFYCAYHHVKAALLDDPVWGDISRMHRLHPDLIPDDRWVSRHHGRKGLPGAPRQWGINDLVLLLYPSIVKQYEQLHQASIDVRYSTGLPPGALEALPAAVEHVRTEVQEGHLVAGDRTN